ncbi:molybdopterin cofactor-binding domain-containing protein [Sphingomonas hankookensis]|uniref:molybdopterin cofactor-binding domain-containing protein n=1 Tax=Sphingomonas hankookensis TaxID=563996 RepID=UPI003D30382E
MAQALWREPRRGGGETIFGPYLKIGADGQVTVAVPQAEHGQGVYTALPQIVADELGADWRTVAVEAAPINPLYANPLAAGILFGDALALLPQATRAAHAERTALMLTAGSTSIRRFEGPLRAAGAAARVLLCKAAATAWGGDWRSCGTADGFVVMGERRERFGVLAERASQESLPGGELPLRTGDEKRLVGTAVPRLDAPAKVDGSATFAADVRRPGMVFASIRQGPIGDTRLLSVDTAAAERVPGVTKIVRTDRWVAAVGTTWWAANRAVDALAPGSRRTGWSTTRRSPPRSTPRWPARARGCTRPAISTLSLPARAPRPRPTGWPRRCTPRSSRPARPPTGATVR